MVFNPLEQFEILPFFPGKITSVLSPYLIYTNLFETVFLNLALGFFFFFLIISFAYWIPKSFLQFLLEGWGRGVTSLFLENGVLGLQRVIPLIFILSFVLLFFNLSGMVPYTFTVTSHIFVTMSLSFIFFFSINFIGIQKHKWQFLSIFLPSGVPLFIMPFLLLIEFFSYFSRLFSLAIRLFANLMAGHTLLKILSSFAFSILISGSLFFVLNIFPVIIILLIIGMEVGIALLQVYVFLVLVSIYFKDIFSMDH